MTGIIETKLKYNQKAIQNTDIPNYNISINCLTEGPNGGALIYIKNDIIYKVRNNLKIYQSQKLESVFLEIINSNSIQFNPLIQVKIIVYINSPEKNIGLQILFDSKYQIKH